MQKVMSMLHGGKTQSDTAAGSGAGGIGADSEGPVCGQITVQVVQGGAEGEMTVWQLERELPLRFHSFSS